MVEIYPYDNECYPNFFSCTIRRKSDNAKWVFEISEWVNQGVQLNAILRQIAASGGELMGFRNIPYDYPLLHFLMEHDGYVTHVQLYQFSQAIFNADNDYVYRVWDNKMFVPQIDLSLIHHFDNKAKMTSLKILEFNMMMDDIIELPYDPSLPLTRKQADHILSYNDHDVIATGLFGDHTEEMIAFRRELSDKYGKNFMNLNDTAIGVEIVKMELVKRGVNVHKSNQTIRDQINVGEIILPYVSFETDEFNAVLNFFRGAIIDPEKIKGFFKDSDDATQFTSATINGFTFDFGAGGIHGSLHKTVVTPNDDEELIDSDVASYYPSLGIVNKLHPEHLGAGWCDVMDYMFNERKRVGKKTVMGGAYKLALNGSYGKTNDKYSPFLDAQYTMAITINGQLLLCMLAEQLMKIPNLRMVQINTDGLTYVCPKQYVDHAMLVSQWWEQLTMLELEHAHYSKMAIRDVNNYLAVTTDGYVKRIGAYAHERQGDKASTREMTWNKNHSALVIPKAAEAALVHGTNIEQFIRNHNNPYDFYLRTKVPRSAELYHGDKRIQNVSRYYVSNEGSELVKVMRPTEKQIIKWKTGLHWQHIDTGAHKMASKQPSGKWQQILPPSNVPPDRRIGIQSGKKVIIHNTVSEMTDLNYQYYIDEARKLVDPLLTGDRK